MAGRQTTIGVLALQGAVREHLAMLERCEARGIAVKRPAGLDGVNGLIIPGGESTSIGILLAEYGFIGALRRLASEGVPMFGTCAGLILMASRVRGRHGPALDLMDIAVGRNAFGRQVDSFEQDVRVEGIEEPDRPFRGVFIRAPVIEEAGGGVEVMARVAQGIVAARQDNLLAAAFHPELTHDTRLHRYFLKMAEEYAGGRETEV